LKINSLKAIKQNSKVIKIGFEDEEKDAIFTYFRSKNKKKPSKLRVFSCFLSNSA
jgi:hypothetical protein